MTISLCMIVKNEKDFLENCLNSVKDVVDELIIVDTGSKDKTKEIAKKFTDKIYDFEWNHSFSEARNFSIRKATKEWILILDADETINKKDQNKILNLLENQRFSAPTPLVIKDYNENKRIMGFSFIQRTYSSEIKKLKWNYRKSDFYDESKPFIGWNYRGITRLFRNDKRIKFIYPIHETVIESIRKIDGKIHFTNIPIHHLEILKGRDFINKKSDYYIKLLKNKIKLHPKAKSYFELALELKKLNKDSEAKIYFEKSAGLNPNYKELIINSP